MPKNKMPKPKPRSKLPDLPDAEAIKRLFPKKVLEQVQAVIQGSSVKKSHK